MHSVSIAEWIVGRFTSAAEAASIVGDLEEQRPRKGVLWFWASLAGFFFLLCWRRFVALGAAIYLGDRAFQAAVLSTKAQQHHSLGISVLLFLVIAFVGYFLWMTFIYAIIRYGLRDKMTQRSLLWSGLVTAVFVSWWHPPVLFFSIALGALQVFVSMAKPEGRRQLLMLAMTVGSGFVSYLLILLVIRFGFSAVYSTAGPSSLVLGHSSISWIKFPLSFMAAWATTSVYSRMRSWVSQWNEPKTTNGPDLS